jgi:hypothetical protein
VEEVSRVLLNFSIKVESSEVDPVSHEVGVPIESEIEKSQTVMVES